MKRVILIFLLSICIYADVNIDSLEKEANKGSVKAILKLANIYENGIGVKKDLTKAKGLYLKAVKLGNSDAKLSIALVELERSVDRNVSLNNSVTLKDREHIFRDLTKDDIKDLIIKAKQGDKNAIFSLGVIYENGYGVVKQDKKRAISLYKKAYSLGSKKAESILELEGVITE